MVGPASTGARHGLLSGQKRSLMGKLALEMLSPTYMAIDADRRLIVA